MLEVNYSFCDRLLHYLALGLPWVGKVSLDLERLFISNSKVYIEGKPIFINGLARSGTTILMRTFYETGLFRSLTYRDLPFVMMPGIWKQISKFSFQQKAAQERAHGDGIMESFDSPEAFEEIYWRTFCADDYIFDDHIKPHFVSQEVVDQFKGFVRQVVMSADQPSQNRYLAKNNNNILRLGALKKAFPEALIIIPFRDPVQQSFSLLQQHKKFSTIQEKDSFARHYMGWLGHYEFGATHKKFWFENGFSMLETSYTPDNVNYWLTVWINTYRYILESAPPKSLFFSFEALCRSPETVLMNLFSQAGVSTKVSCMDEKIRAPRINLVKNIDVDLKNQAIKTYYDLSERSN